MGNENNNIQTINENNKSKNTKKKLYINKNNFINFLIKVENGILLPNLNISNSITLNNICIPNKNNFLKNKEIKYIQSINDFTDKKLDENKKFNYDYSYEEKQYIQIINNIFNNNLKNKNNNYPNVINKNKYEIETKKNNISTIETTKREKNNYNNINGNYTERINNELRKLKIFKMGKIENDEIKNENILYAPNSPYSIRTYNTNPRSSNNYFNNTIENSHNHNNSFMTMKNNNIIYNNRMLITSPNSPKKYKSKINNENKNKNKSPKDNTNKKKSPKNNSRNKNIKKIDSKINSKYLVNNNNEIKNIKKYKSPDIKKRYFDKNILHENRNIETSFLSEKEKEKQKEKERNKSMDFNMNNHDKKNRYRNLFDECDEKKISQNTIEYYNNNKYTLINKDLKENEKNNNIKNGIYKSPTTFKKKLINDKPIFQRKKIQEKKVDENIKNIEDKKVIKKKYNKNNEIDKFKNILSNKLDKNKKEKIEYINNIKQINNTENNKLIDNNNINNNNNIKKINKKKKPKKKIFELDELEEKNNTSEIKTNNNININNKYINDVYCSFAPNIEKEIKKEEGIYKSNDLERIIKENKNKKSIKKPNSDINTIFNYIENEYNVSEEENNNNNTNCDRSFSFRQKYTDSFGKEEKNINNINNENIKESEKDIKFSFKINSDINESEFNDINYF